MGPRSIQMTVLVTGAGSYVAQAIIRRLCEKQEDVIATYRSHRPNGLEQAKLVQLDLCDKSGFRKLPRNLGAIIHVAAGTPRHSVSEIVLSATQGLFHLQQYALDSCAGALVLTSSVSIHGRVETKVDPEF